MVPTCFCPWTLNLHIAIVLLCLRVHYLVEIKRYKSQLELELGDLNNEAQQVELIIDLLLLI